ncbi:hypothetical protein HY492_03645 [Candidatus Woesearchaeota archaeon]|nr:hypothetical protein [Candidatus Woesearchaeota archaeon]
MTTDIVLPNRNEQALIARAELLGIDRLILLYAHIPDALPSSSRVKLVPAFLGVKGKAHLKVMRHTEHDLHAVEHDNPSMLVELETDVRADALHQRASGLNHVLARACAKKQVAVAFSFSLLLAASAAKRAQLLGRMMQNIRLCRKFQVQMRIASFASTPEQMRNPADLRALFTLLGMHPKEAQQATS